MTGGRPRGQGAVLMLDGRHGILLHRVTVDALPVVDGTVSGPLLVASAGGRVVVTTGACAPASVLPCVPTRENLSVLDAQTGAVLWSLPLGMTPRVAHSSEAFLPLTAMASGPQGRYVALIGRTGGRVLDLSTRTLSAWTPLPGSACGRPTATDDQAGHIILVRSGWNVNAGQLCSNVSILDARTGRLVHTVTLSSTGRTAPNQQLFSSAVADLRRHRALIIGTNPGMGVPKMPTIRLFDTCTGASLATIALRPEEWPDGAPPVVDTRTGRAFVRVIASVPRAFDRVYARVYMVDMGTGRLLGWTDVLPPGPSGFVAPLLALDEQGGHIYVATPGVRGAGRISVLDGRRGALTNTVTLGLVPDVLAVALRAGRVFAFGADNAAYQVLDAYSGAILATRSLGKPLWPADTQPGDQWPSSVRVTVDAVSGNLFVLHHTNSTVSVLDRYTGRVLTTLTARS